jgi:RNA polymerase sigma factor (sigma-70 family)
MWWPRVQDSQERVADSKVVGHPIDVTKLEKAEIYEKYADQLIRFATGLVGPSNSRDVVSAAVVSAMWSPGWDSVSHERAYLYKAVLNEARRTLHDRERRRVAELQAAGGAQVERIPEIRPDVLEAVARLSVSQRAVVFLAYWEDMRPAEIARFLSLSDGTVHRQLGRAEARLRRILR